MLAHQSIIYHYMYLAVVMGLVTFDELLALTVCEITLSRMSKVEEHQGLDPLRKDELTVRAFDSDRLINWDELCGWIFPRIQLEK